ELGDIRNPVGFACEIRDMHHFAVAANIKGSGDYGYASGATVLTPDCNGILPVILLMVFLPSRFDFKIKFAKRITAVKFMHKKMKLERNRPITFEMLYIVQEIRRMISDILVMKSNRLREIPSSDIGLWIQYLVNVVQSVKESNAQPVRGQYDRKRWWSIYKDIEENEEDEEDDVNDDDNDDDDDDDDGGDDSDDDDDLNGDDDYLQNPMFLKPFNLLPDLSKLWRIDIVRLKEAIEENFQAFKDKQKKQ
ncbi:uncharacterized protein LOC144345993, partial [Saccoglossus kowalevskii]